MELLGEATYPFEKQPLDDKDWVQQNDELSAHNQCLLRIDHAGIEWFTLASSSATDNDRKEDDDILSTDYRDIAVSIRAYLLAINSSCPKRLSQMISARI